MAVNYPYYMPQQQQPQEELLADLIATYGQEIINMTNSIFNRLKKDGELN